MIILGVHAGHDCGAAIVNNGKIIAVANEERITRDKLSFGVPEKSIKEVLGCARMAPDDIDKIALESVGGTLLSHGRPWFYKAFLTNGTGLLDFFFIKDRKFKYIYGLQSVPLNILSMTGFPRFLMTDLMACLYLKKVFGCAKKISRVPHHQAHLASAYFTSGMDNVLSVVIEEYDGRNGMVIDLVQDGQVIPIANSPYPHSPGVFYSLVTRMLGFNQMLHAGKITGLAAYGQPHKVYHLVEKLMWNEDMKVQISPLTYKLVVECARTKNIPAYFSGFSREDIAAAFQRRLEDVMVAIIKKALEKTGAKNIVLSGGVTANVKMNQCIYNINGVENLFIHPGMSDCGTALGAALWESYKSKKFKPFRLKNVFFGYEITDDEVELELKRKNLKYHKEENIQKKISGLLAEKKIITRVRGKMEYGPRALGNRSILYHCSDPSINKWLNQRLRRTEFMPFAPAVLAEYAEKCFVNFKGLEYAGEFMTITCDCTEWMKENCPAVVHIDGTARPQIVTPESNPDFYTILSEYNKITGIPVLINTSYNIHDEPIVRSAADALRVFKFTCLDYLAINDYLVSAKENNFIWGKI
ncbi:MAG: carbamoyltransferase C-terminal domain-containing protein [Candidatus Omnitrophota bacterium]